jgi:glutaredoxin
MNSDSIPVLYIKPGCPWCHEVIDFLQENGIAYDEKNVRGDPAALAEMKAKSGQLLAPTLDWHGEILADFGVSELKPFLAEHGVKLAAK